MINEIAFFAYPVTDMARARAFYENILGLKVESNFMDRWVEYGIGGGTLAIAATDANHTPGANGGFIGLEVDDFDKTIAQLKQNAVKFLSEPGTTPVCRMATVADPDGNQIIIHKRTR